MRDTARSFPINQNLEVVRWKFSTRDETAVPLSSKSVKLCRFDPQSLTLYPVNCWPSPAGDGTCDVNIEYELEAEHLELRDVIISIPLP